MKKPELSYAEYVQAIATVAGALAGPHAYKEGDDSFEMKWVVDDAKLTVDRILEAVGVDAPRKIGTR